MADPTPYQRLAKRLDSLPNGFPPTEDGSHLRLLEYLFSPEEAELAADLSPEPETPRTIALRIDRNAAAVRSQLKDMARKGLITAGRSEGGMGYSLMPFVVGIYEMQAGRIDAELASRFEAYFRAGFRKALAIQPPFHRVLPVQESVKTDISIAPFESAAGVVDRASAWAVTDCICRKQTALIGRPCPHPLEACMVMSTTPGAFHELKGMRELTKQGALDLLVHSVANTREGNWYICNCCTCSCGILRGMAEGGMASVIARSGFFCQVDETTCGGCGVCEERCPFKAITVDGTAHVEKIRCAGCGVCTVACPNGALSLVRRADTEDSYMPKDEEEWRQERTAWRINNPSP
jgi:electron transport complex protein RnfB